ncbi:MAG: hypothetical protein IPM29_07970 [Planctomycetes bacterium]|nr:hypothetical protein [Planctomycetota bacterium]
MRSVTFVTMFALGCLTPLVSQEPVVATWQARTQLLARAALGSNSLTSTLPIGTDLMPGVTLFRDALSNEIWAEFRSTFMRPADGSVVATIDEHARATSVLFVDGVGRLGTHSTELRIVPTRALPATVRVTYATIVRRGTGSRPATIEVDVDGDGTVDFAAQQGETRTESFQVSVPASGLTIVTTTYLRAESAGAGSVEHHGRTTVEFIPPPATTFSAYGPAAVLSLRGDDAFRGPVRDVRFQSDGPINAIGAELFGSRRAAVPIPGTACMLLNDGLIALPFRYGAGGLADLVHSVPWDMTFFLEVQLFAIDPGSTALLCSGGLEVVTR